MPHATVLQAVGARRAGRGYEQRLAVDVAQRRAIHAERAQVARHVCHRHGAPLAPLITQPPSLTSAQPSPLPSPSPSPSPSPLPHSILPLRPCSRHCRRPHPHHCHRNTLALSPQPKPTPHQVAFSVTLVIFWFALRSSAEAVGFRRPHPPEKEGSGSNVVRSSGSMRPAKAAHRFENESVWVVLRELRCTRRFWCLLVGYVALFSSRTATKFLAVFARNELHRSMVHPSLQLPPGPANRSRGTPARLGCAQEKGP